jgi:hypothetical protein
VKDFQYAYVSKNPPPDVLRECLSTWNGELADNGYSLTTQSEIGLTYHKKYRPWWLVFPVVLFFPLGLLALLITSDAHITATITPIDDGSKLDVSGKGSKYVREAFEELQV